ncbi:monothiol glutaredoxin-S1 [Gossypium australe]|uniref:Monothiol glutaredoxin-S1 n=1 Tax=Gossypium australe TaxID=47621 RepID=A0A5B6V1Q9_9ROSI|nr:monothiol glutaredoxin-S1 [Gossypium australe]
MTASPTHMKSHEKLCFRLRVASSSSRFKQFKHIPNKLHLALTLPGTLFSAAYITMDVVTSMVADRPVVIFSRTTCCMSHTIKTLINGYGANFTVYELDEIQNGQQVERELQQMGCNPSVPAVFIGQRLVGGANQVMSLQLRNQLVPLLKRAGAIWI